VTTALVAALFGVLGVGFGAWLNALLATRKERWEFKRSLYCRLLEHLYEAERPRRRPRDARDARSLNAAGIPGPRRRGPWAASSIRAMIFNPLYRGELVWGRTRWADQGGTKRKLDVPDSSAWVTVPAPALRIIDEALWKATHERLAQGRAVYLARTGGEAWGRPLNPTESKYLLTGLLRCKHCGGRFHVSKQSGRRGQGLWLYYVCARQRTRGIPCPGALRVRSSVVDEAVLEDLGGKLMAPERITAAVRRAAARLTAKPDSGRGRRSRLTRELRALDQELGRYAEAIATAGPRLRSWRPSRAGSAGGRPSPGSWASSTPSSAPRPWSTTSRSQPSCGPSARSGGRSSRRIRRSPSRSSGGCSPSA
jgi:hypothetical protein